MIDVENLVYTYPKAAEPTLKGLSFNIAKQEILGFLGPSGAGKSTTQKLLIGLLTNYEGSAKVQGKEVRAWGSDFYEEVGVSFEFPNHHQRLTALENLHHFGALYSGKMLDPMEVLGWVDLQDHANKRVSDFSKGMKIRLNVARSLLHRPKILFLDEPTSGLDPVNAKRVKDLIFKVRDEGTTVFLTTHDMKVADDLCDRVAFLNGGEIAAIDAPSVLKKRYGARQLAVEYRESDALHSQTFPLDDLSSNKAFQDLLACKTIETMHSQETTLENVFIEITGNELHV